MTTPFESAVLLTVRGTFLPESLEAMRLLHNETVGSEQGIAAARSMGDLSHNVYAPSQNGQLASTDSAKEVLFLDWWDSPKGLMDFFSVPMVQHQGAKLFAKRDTAVWMPAQFASSYHLPAPKATLQRFVGVIRGAVQSPEQAITTFAEVDQ